MRKYILISGFLVVGLFAIVLFYLSVYGIKTNNFNSFINDKVKDYDSKISLKLNDVYLKLNLGERSIKINTNNTKVSIDKNFINLSNIDINLDLLKFLRNENSVKKIQIISEENTLKNVTNFLNSYKFNISRSIAYSQIHGGNIKALVNIYFDKKDNDSFSYEIKGNVKDTSINLIGDDNLKKINFNFDIQDKVYNFENIIFEYQNINYQSKKISIVDSGGNFEIGGILNSEKGLIKPNSFSKLFNINLDILDEKEILIETENKFAFKINSNLSVKDVKLKSNIKFHEIFINKKYQDLIYLKDGKIETEYLNNDLSVHVSSKFSFFEGKDKKDDNDLNLHIVKKNKENFKIRGDLKNNKTSIDPKVLFELAKIRLDILSNDKILIETENKFAFQVDEDQKIKDLSINSSLNFDKLYFNNEFQNLIYLKDGKIETFIKDKDFEVEVDSRYSFLNEKYNNKENEKIIKLNIKKNQEKSIDIETLFKTKKTKINSKELIKYLNLKDNLIKDQDIELDSDNKINFSIDKKNKIKNLKLKSILKFDKLEIDYTSNTLKKFIPDYNNKVYLTGDNIEINYSKDETKIQGNGKYTFKDKFDNFKIKIINKKNQYEFDTSFDLNNFLIKVDEIDYSKQKNISSNINLRGHYLNNNELNFNEVNFLEGKNKIFVSNLNLTKNLKIKNIDKLELNYFNNKKKLNDIKISKYKDNFELTGNHYDGRLLVENLLKGNSNNNFLKIFKNLNSEIVLDIDQFYLGDKSYLEKIVGKLIIKENKIKSGNIDAYLNKKNKFTYNLKTTSSNEKITNLYIEEPEPFIKNYKFIKGFKKGILKFDSTEISGLSKSKLKIYDFKVKEIPLLAKILTLASLQGIADLLTGEGIRFSEFDMTYVKKNTNTTIKEMYAIGPALSILMEGYIVKDELTSLRGTLVPATTINKTIKKIPLLGNILVGKKVGEGVFGVSFKIKGPPKDLKTTVNPVKTLTPRFITRTLEKLKGN